MTKYTMIGWLVDLAGAVPLGNCLHSNSSTAGHFLDTIVLFYSFTAWRLLNASLSRKKSQVYKIDNSKKKKSIF